MKAGLTIDDVHTTWKGEEFVEPGYESRVKTYTELLKKKTEFKRVKLDQQPIFVTFNIKEAKAIEMYVDVYPLYCKFVRFEQHASNSVLEINRAPPRSFAVTSDLKVLPFPQ